MKTIGLVGQRDIIGQVIKTLRSGGLVVFPTDTVYGLLVDAKNEDAVKKLIAFKERPVGKPISVFVSGFEMMRAIVEVSDNDRARLEHILPGPYTAVLKSKGVVSSLLESEKKTLGVRVPDSKLVTELMMVYKNPVTATSANRSGHPSVHSISALMNQLNVKQKEMIDLVVDAGELPHNRPSTVIDLTGDDIEILREGDLKFSSSKTYKSNSEEETKEIARKIIRELSSQRMVGSMSLIFIIKGDLGAGKTQFVKGIASGLGITDQIISPTYVVSYEYPIVDAPFKNLIHMDLYNVNDAEEFKFLGINKYFREPNIFCIEWGERSGEVLEEFKKNADLIYIHISYSGPKTREITLNSTS